MSQPQDTQKTGTEPKDTPERKQQEKEFIQWLEKYKGHKLTEQKKNLAIVQAESVGEL